jgi:hypothetical protein
MATEQPNYQIRHFSESTFNKTQLMQVLAVLPISVMLLKDMIYL